jgi:hypothetical protein
VRDENEIVADDVDPERGEDGDYGDPELPVAMGATPVRRVGVKGRFVGLVGGVGVVGFQISHYSL